MADLLVTEPDYNNAGWPTARRFGSEAGQFRDLHLLWL